LALKADGTVVGWGHDTMPGSINGGRATPPVGLSNVVAIAAAWSYSLALKSDGSVVVWGDNSFGQTDLAERLSNIVAISTYPNTSDGSLALQKDGTLIGWPMDEAGPNLVAGLSNIAALAVGAEAYKGLAVNNNGTLAVWGDNNTFGQTNLPLGLSNVAAASMGLQHSLALKRDGTVSGWGTSFAHSASGSPYCDQVTPPPGLGNVVAVAAGRAHSLAISVGLRLSSIKLQEQTPIITFHGFSGQQYSIEYSADLTPGSWIPVSGAPSPAMDTTKP